MFSESSAGRWAVLQLPCGPNKENELSEKSQQNLFHDLPPQTVEADTFYDRCESRLCSTNVIQRTTYYGSRRPSSSKASQAD